MDTVLVNANSGIDWNTIWIIFGILFTAAAVAAFRYFKGQMQLADDVAEPVENALNDIQENLESQLKKGKETGIKFWDIFRASFKTYDNFITLICQKYKPFAEYCANNEVSSIDFEGFFAIEVYWEKGRALFDFKANGEIICVMVESEKTLSGTWKINSPELLSFLGIVQKKIIK